MSDILNDLPTKEQVIERLIRERDEARAELAEATRKPITAAMKVAISSIHEAEQRGYRLGVENAAEVVEAKFSAHGWNYHLPSVGGEMAAAILALLEQTEPSLSPEDKLR